VTVTLGARLGPYEIVALLGVGGMGEVFCGGRGSIAEMITAGSPHIAFL